jgi:hypothetical protein
MYSTQLSCALKKWFLGAGGEMIQALYAHMNNKTIKKRLSQL